MKNKYENQIRDLNEKLNNKDNLHIRKHFSIFANATLQQRRSSNLTSTGPKSQAHEVKQVT